MEAFDLVGPAQQDMQAQLSQMATASESAHDALLLKDQEIVLLNKKLNESFERIAQLSGGLPNQPKLEIVSKRVEKEEMTDALIKMSVDLSPWLKDGPTTSATSQPDVESITVAVNRCRRQAVKHERELQSVRDSLLDLATITHTDRDLYSINELLDKLKDKLANASALKSTMEQLADGTSAAKVVPEIRTLLSEIHSKDAGVGANSGQISDAVQYIRSCPTASQIAELKTIITGGSQTEVTTPEEVMKQTLNSLKLIRNKTSLPNNSINDVIESVLSQTVSKSTEEALRTVVRLPHINSFDNVVTSAITSLKALRQKDTFRKYEDCDIEDACHQILSSCPSDAVIASISESSALPHNDIDYKLSVIVRTMNAIRTKEQSSNEKDIETITEEMLTRVVSPDTLSEGQRLLKQPRASAENVTSGALKTVQEIISISGCDFESERRGSVRREASISPTPPVTGVAEKITESIRHRLASPEALETLKSLSCRDHESSTFISLESLINRVALILENIWSKFQSHSGTNETDVVMASNHLFNNCLIQDHVIPLVRGRVGAGTDQTTEDCIQKLVDNYVPETAMRRLRDVAELPMGTSFEKLVEEFTKMKMKRQTVEQLKKVAETPQNVEFTNMDSLIETVLLKIPSQPVMDDLRKGIPGETGAKTIDELITTALSNNADISVLTNDRQILEEELQKAEHEVSRLRSELSDVSHLKQQLLVSPVKQQYDDSELDDLRRQLEQSEARRLKCDADHNATIDDLTSQLRTARRMIDPVNSQDEIEFLEKKLEVSEQKRLAAESIVREGSTRSRSLAIAAERSLEELKRKRQVDEAKLETLMTEFRSSGATPSPRSPPQSSPCPQGIYNEDDVLNTPIMLDEHTILSPEMNSLQMKLQQAVAIADRDGSPAAIENVNRIQRDIQRKMQLERAVERGHSPTIAVRLANLEELLRERGDQVEKLMIENSDLKQSLASASQAAAEAAVRVVVAAPDEDGNLEVSELREVISQKDIIIASLHQEIARIESSLAEYERNAMSSKQDLRDIAVEREGLESQVRLLKKQSRRGEADTGTGKGRYPDLEREKELKRQLEAKNQEMQLLLDRSPRRENALRQQLEEKDAIIEALTRESPRVKHARLQKTVEEQTEQIEDMRHTIERLRMKTSPASSPRGSTTSLRAQIHDQQQTIDSLKKSESTIASLQKQLDDQDSTIRSLKQRIETLQKSNSVHKDLQQRFDAQQESISDLKSTISTLRGAAAKTKKGEVNKLKSQVEDQQLTISNLERTLKQKENAEESLVIANDKQREAQQQLRHLKDENDDLQKQVSDFERSANTLKKQLQNTRETDSEQADVIDRLETDVAKLQTQLRQAPSQSAYDTMKKEHTTLTQEHNNLLEDVEQLTEQIGVLQATIMNDQTERDGIDSRTRDLEKHLRAETANKLRLKNEYLEMQQKLNGTLPPSSPRNEYNDSLNRLSKLESELVTALKYLQLSDVFDERLIEKIIAAIEELTNEQPSHMDVREVIKDVLRNAIASQQAVGGEGQVSAELRRLQGSLDSLASEYDELHPRSALSQQKPIVDRIRFHLDTLFSDLTSGSATDGARVKEILAQEIQKRRMADAKVHQLQQQLSRGRGKLNREHQLEEDIRSLKNANEELRLDNNDLRYKISSDLRDKQVLDYKQKVQDNKSARIKRENKALRTRVRHVEDENEDLSRVVSENLRAGFRGRGTSSRASSRHASPMLSHQSRSPRPTPLSSPHRSRLSPHEETWTLDDI
eukprot:TRINITY_DN21592_c0_g1_i2.p1 TRINITY_DN21592_c0_g1~~TRINITY_DN21592_c0_g1_i2.p1  ORF type:complete len:2046 (+),score=570.10 TRINITY_DN21592_c0_g1_i2:866-6139(+)